MKHLYSGCFFLLGLLLFSSPLSAQQLHSSGVRLSVPASAPATSPDFRGARVATVSCLPDSIRYAQAKATGLRAISLNAGSSADKLGQYYDCPQPLTISGFSFYAWQNDAVSNNPVTLTARIYAAGADSLPTGSPLASGTAVVDTNFYGGNVNALRKNINFSSPVTVTSAYVVTVETAGSVTVSVLCNDWAPSTGPADGDMEWLGMASVAGSWLHGYDLNVGAGIPFDCDVILEPRVSYELAPSFTANPTCFSGTTTVTFTSTSSPVLLNRMYNLAAFVGAPELSFDWNFGDGTTLANVIDTTHTYTTTSAFTVTQTDTMFGWTVNCFDDTSIVIGNVPPATAWTSSGSGLIYSFSDQTTGNPTSWLWDFGDGNTSTQQNPNHTYAATGTYTVCLTTSSNCGSDSSCGSITVTNCPTPAAAFSSVPNLLTVTFTDLSTSGSTPAWLWDFGDGNTSTQQNPAHTYAAAGTYTVCLTVSDPCGTDSSCSSVTVNCPQPTAGFGFVPVNRQVTFTNNSTGATSYLWDFGDGNTDTTTSPVYTYAADGTYTVCLTATNSCGSQTQCDTITVMLIGREADLAGQWDIYPNPASHRLVVKNELPQAFASTLHLIDLAGRSLLTHQVDPGQTIELEIPVESLENGLYFLQIQTGAERISRKILIQR